MASAAAVAVTTKRTVGVERRTAMVHRATRRTAPHTTGAVVTVKVADAVVLWTGGVVVTEIATVPSVMHAEVSASLRAVV